MTTSKRIHILGLGNLGRLFAHSLANKPNPPPITLLFHRPSLLQEWSTAGHKIHITTHGVTNSHGSFEIEEALQHINPPPTQNSDQNQNQDHQEPIQNLIVTTKTTHTVKAINAIKSRLSRDSTILFAQNGMGTIEEVTKTIFPDERNRPNFLAAITSHGVYSQGPFRSVHAGLANTTIGQVNGNERSRYLLDQIVNSPILAATEVSSSETLKAQLEKLVVNAMINPLTVLFDCKNGELFTRPEILDVMRNMLVEVYEVFLTLPSEIFQGEERFSLEKLEERVLSIGVKTAENTSSMRQDVQAGRETEIEYINGWIVRKGRENGVRCVWNEKVIEMVKKGTHIPIADIGDYFRVKGGEVSLKSRLTSENFLELQEANQASTK